MTIKLGSLFDGIGVFPLAAARCGITPVWASEIEKAPISITKRHFPDMAHLGSSGFSAVTTGIRLTDMRGENVSLICSPFVCSSSAQLPRASKAASFPARNRFLARLQPSTPAPYTKIFM